MATSSASAQEHSTPPLLEGPPTVTIATSAASRRLPPPCWSHDETVALIDAYRDKWYSLRRGNLRANHWQEVANDVASRCPIATPKTAVQCRHKMEKLRKRYRGEIQRAAPYGGSKSHRYCSTWVHFKLLDAMEKGPNSAAAAEAHEDEEDQEDSHVKRIGDIYNTNSGNNLSSYLNNNSNRSSFHGSMMNGGTGFRIRIPGRGNVGDAAAAKIYSRFDEMGGQNPNPNMYSSVNYGSNKVLRGDMGKRVIGGEVKKGDPVAEMVSAIRVLGDGFVRMERMKMEMAREVEEMRMEMEMKRTEMILESQQRIVEAFAKAISEKKLKKVKGIQNQEC